MKHTRRTSLYSLVFTLLCGMSPVAHAQGAGTEWDILNREAMELYRTGKYDRAVVVAQKALQVAEQNVGPNHPDVAASLENLAGLYRATKRNNEALALEKRAARIRAIKRTKPQLAGFKDGRLQVEADLSDPKVIAKLAAQAIEWANLQRDEFGRYHLSDHDESYTGWIKKTHDNGKVALLGALISGEPTGKWKWFNESGVKTEEKQY